MAEKISFDTPKDVGGGLGETLIIDEMIVVAISFNRQKANLAEGNATLGILLEHPASGWTENIEIRGADALSEAKKINTGNFSVISLHTRILEKLLADGKIPAGIITGGAE